VDPFREKKDDEEDVQWGGGRGEKITGRRVAVLAL